MADIQLSDEKIYEQIIIRIRATDEISFKLMGIVPLVSGTGLVTLFFGKDAVHPAVVILLSLFAAAITLGLLRWELRNIQTCKRLLKYADALEKEALEAAHLKGSYVHEPKRPPQWIGKSQAEKLIYAVTITTWLAFPHLLISSNELSQSCWSRYITFITVVIALATVVSLFACTEPKECSWFNKLLTFTKRKR